MPDGTSILSCQHCKRLPYTTDEAQEMRSVALCYDCRGVARSRGWKPADGLTGAFEVMSGLDPPQLDWKPGPFLRST